MHIYILWYIFDILRSPRCIHVYIHKYILFIYIYFEHVQNTNYTQTHLHMNVCKGTPEYAFIHIHPYIYTHTWLPTNKHMHMNVCKGTPEYAFIHIYMSCMNQKCTQMYAFIHIHMYGLKISNLTHMYPNVCIQTHTHVMYESTICVFTHSTKGSNACIQRQHTYWH